MGANEKSEATWHGADDLREKVAAALWAADYGGGYYDAADHGSAEADFYRAKADAVLAVLDREPDRG